MIFRHVMDMPRLVSGIDYRGRPWTCLHFPEAFGKALSEQPHAQRVKTLRGILADFKRSVPNG